MKLEVWDEVHDATPEYLEKVMRTVIRFHTFRENERVVTVRRGPEAGKVKRSWTHRACARGLTRDVPKVASIVCASFFDVLPDFEHRDDRPIVYLDPPYRGCFPYEAVGAFDYGRFLAHVRVWSAECDIFVSEYDFPYGSVVWEKPTRTGFGAVGLTERLFYVPRGSAVTTALDRFRLALAQLPRAA